MGEENIKGQMERGLKEKKAGTELRIRQDEG